jgi:hypothetical protein
MATRTIVTSQPDVACDVCERRLLRGEQPDVFIAAGRRLTVCELCAPRATHEGWMRESDSAPVALPPTRGRRGRSLLDRFRQARTPAASEPGYEFLDGGAGPVPARPHRRQDAAPLDWAEPDLAAQAELVPPSYLEQAVAVFNASEFPRRVAGVARSLGAPEVTVRSAEQLDSVVRVVVAWELSWYRYEVDLSDGLTEARVLGQGSELAELDREERLANASANEAGLLSLTGAG